MPQPPKWNELSSLLLQRDDGTADGWASSERDGVAGQSGRNGCLKVVLLRLRPLLPDGEIAIVDTATVDFAEIIPVRPENGCLWCGGYVGHAHQSLPRIQHRVFCDCKILIVPANDSRGVFGVGKYPPDTDTLLRELTTQTRYFWDVAVGDWTIAGGENEDHNTDTGTGEFLDMRALKIQSVGLTGMD